MQIRQLAVVAALGLAAAACQSSSGSTGGDPGGTKLSVAEVAAAVKGHTVRYENENYTVNFVEFRADGTGRFRTQSGKKTSNLDWDVNATDGLCMRNITPPIGSGPQLCFADVRRLGPAKLNGIAGGKIQGRRDLDIEG